MELLQIKQVSREFGGLKAIQDVSFPVRQGSIHGVIGPNGSGKTTLFNVISGYYKPTQGEVWFENKPIHALSPFQVNRAGLARTFQNLRLFKKMTVLENVCAVLDRESGIRIWDYVVAPKRVFRIEKETIRKAEALLEVFDLLEWRDFLAENLPYGVQKRLEIARALATHPKLLLLDEPAAGLNHTETDELARIIRYIRDERGITVLVIEHDMKLMMTICETITVMNEGMVLTEGTPNQVSKNKQVITAYLGGEW
ncbi:ABC transporter ATP-binding protein [Fodinisporobacter ferrooxydans]|uniref:ABC transporter ATP-binding protein n=1 Tax=Fodinisporobacter ferrooxydans TaxID=2901836 RepID=A0ABY4CLG7_9BACL|nr:ABC transporter ATP-binding protein [Alicyclobacillaceae bacterium MYW30-H2]UOF91171.1 ABC transporter ATP-binding protein [Alicyclobacillaceae bacterium MYW30-H2]